jgi:hypothetical protein
VTGDRESRLSRAFSGSAEFERAQDTAVGRAVVQKGQQAGDADDGLSPHHQDSSLNEDRSTRRTGKARRARRRELPDGSEERSNDGWRFTDERGDGIIEG